MATEIERKFLVRVGLWQPPPVGEQMRQGYLCATPDRGVRVRIADDKAFLTIKANRNERSRFEFEYPIPLADAAEMLDQLCERPLIEKVRYAQMVGRHEWTVDVFSGDNDGLIVAEVELEREDEVVDPPPWAGLEVTRLPRYLNANLIRYPYRLWTPEERQGADGQP